MADRNVLGIDAGATTTRALIVDAAAVPLWQGEGGPGNPHEVGLEGLIDSIGVALDGAPRRPLAGVVAGVAGVATAEERAAAAAAIGELAALGGVAVEVVSDLEIAQAGAFSGGPGIILVAGTGSAAWGRDASGRVARAGGWGPILDDRGSGVDLGLQALHAVVRAADERGPMTWLSELVTEILGLDGVEELRRVPVVGLGRHELAALAPAVVEAATAGDRPARDILEDAAAELAACVEAVAGSLELESPEVALAGGLLDAPSLYRDLVADALGDIAGARIVSVRATPVEGAARLALAAGDER